MARRYIYFCDECGEDFGNDAHINIRHADVNLSWASKRDDDPTKSKWSQKNLLSGLSRELHFCGHECIGEFIRKLMVQAVTTIGG